MGITVPVWTNTRETGTMDRKAKGPRRTLLVALLAALLLHVTLGPAIVGVMVWLDRSTTKEEPNPKMVSLTLEKKLSVTKPTKPVVTIPPPRHEQRPARASFLSEFDSSVKRQTQAKHKHAGKFLSNRSNPVPGKEQQPSSSSGPSPHKGAPHTPAPTPLDMRSDQHQPGKPLPEGDQTQPRGGKPARKAKTLSIAQLTPSPGQLQRALGSAFPDAISDVPESNKTLLNTKRWRFSSFFNRVKSAVAQQWHPDKVYKRRDPTGKVYGFRPRLTVLRVWLYPDGRLKQVIILKSSGLDFLDDEAVRAFRKAAPFPNPPKRLVDGKTRMITFTFGFLFEIVKGPIFKVFRYH